ncbi:ADP-ribosylation [Coprinellus micaceus]|uniref:ADP-ribosylation n=1 Tax=Coprinellus micaceus TaxID=71717 RepID=A0A4Y7T8J0_COPMI|nr:ADP-ribosylation [Coprinellus micaceus]
MNMGSDDFSDWSDVGDDTDSLASNLRFMNIRASTRSPPPKYSSTTSLPGYTSASKCIICQEKPPYSNPRTGQSYPTCGLTCAAVLSQQGTPRSSRSGSSSRSGTPGHTKATRRTPFHMAAYHSPRSIPFPIPQKRPDCVVCKTKSTHRGYLTCGLTCAEKLCKDGSDPTMCNPKSPNHDQCGDTCAEQAKVACLLCKCRPKNGAKYHLCGKTCHRIAMKATPMILEAPKGHKTYEMAEKKFQDAWNNVTGPLPTIKKIFKIIENDEFLKPYAIYRKKVGNEHFRYHGTKRECQLGVTATELCTSATCAVCNILKTSFQVSLAHTGGAFGPGVYSSSASNKAFSYCGVGGAMLVTKVILGKIRTVTGWNEVMSCPDGFNSVVFDRMNGQLNETIVYTDDAIRPVFLITF